MGELTPIDPSDIPRASREDTPRQSDKGTEQRVYDHGTLDLVPIELLFRVKVLTLAQYRDMIDASDLHEMIRSYISDRCDVPDKPEHMPNIERYYIQEVL